MNNLEKLQKLAKVQQKRSSKQAFKKVGIYLGVEPSEYFAKKKDADGNNVTDEAGHAVREEVASGFLYTFSEVGTSKLLKVVVSKRIDVKMLSAYVVAGEGYNIASGNLIFLDTKGKVGLYK